MPDLRSDFWAPHRERVALGNADRRDLLEMMGGQAAYFDRVYSQSGESERSRAEFVADALENVPMFIGFTADELEADRANPLIAAVSAIFGQGADLLTGLDPDSIYSWLSDIEAAARHCSASMVAVRAARARTVLVESDLGTTGFEPDVALKVLLQLRELVRLLDDLLIGFLDGQAWLELLAGLLAEAFSEEEAEQGDCPAVLEHGPPPLVLLSAVQPHAPPGCFFSAPRGESVEMRLSQVREGLMAA